MLVLINPETLPDGKSQAIGFIGVEGEGWIVCVFEAGTKYVSKILRFDEKISALSGNIWINGVRLIQGTERRFKKGTVLTIEARKVACFMRKTIGRNKE